MKSTHAVPPLAALLLAGLGLGWQQRLLSKQTEENEALQRQLRHFPARENSPAAASTGAVRKALWVRFAPQLSPYDFKPTSVEELDAILVKMSADELVASLREVRDMDLPRIGKLALTGRLLWALSLVKPEALAELPDLTTDGDPNFGILFGLQGCLGRWADKDGAAAAAWLDEQLAAGKYSPEIAARLRWDRYALESSLVQSLMVTDPAMAESRLRALPAGKLREIFDGLSNPTRESAQAYAVLARRVMPVDQEARSMASLGYSIVRNFDREAVSTFLSDIQPTPAERTAIAVSAVASADQSGRDKPEAMREILAENLQWLRDTAPDAGAADFSGVLEHWADNHVPFDAIAELAIRYDTEIGGDQILDSLLASNSGKFNSSVALTFLDRIQDPARREQLRAALQSPDHP